jgi:hypothetical protein
MRNHVLNIGIAIIALSGLPSCTTGPADEANEVSDVGLAENVASPSGQAGEPSSDVYASDVKSTEESASNEDVRNNVIEGNAIAPKLSCGLNTYDDGHCYIIVNCSGDVIHRRIVKTNGVWTSCFTIPPGGNLNDCLYSGRVWYMEAC